MAVRVDEVLAVWREAERALDSLPDEAPERPVILIQVARLRRAYARLTQDAIPASRELIDSTQDAITETWNILAEAHSRIEASRGSLSETDRLMEEWLLAEQALNRVDDDRARRARLMEDADNARDRYQAALDKLEPGLTD